MKNVRRTILIALILTVNCFGIDTTLPANFCEQLTSHIFSDFPKDITAAHVTMFTPRRVRAVLKDQSGKDQKKELLGLYLEWTAYGDADGEKGIAFTMKVVGVYLFDDGKLVASKSDKDVEWLDSKPEKLDLKIWLARKKADQPVESPRSAAK